MNVILLVAHCDDETIGAGGLIPKLIHAGHSLTLIVGSDKDLIRGKGINNSSALRKAAKFYGIRSIHSLGLEDQMFDALPIAKIGQKILEVIGDPDMIISHSMHDLNRDHRIMAEVAKIVGRPTRKPISLLAMEISGTPAWNNSHFTPNFYVDISDTITTKAKGLEFYANEIRDFPHPTSLRAMEVMAQFRGMESGTDYAEAYQIIRLHKEHAGF